MVRILHLAIAPLFAAVLGAQQFIETFPVDGAGAPAGWTAQNGTWQVIGGRLQSTSGGSWVYITRNGLIAQDCVLDGEFFYNTATAVQFAGLTARYQGPGDSNTLMCKIQNNGGVADFDRVFLYERGASGNTFVDIPGGTVDAYCRMIVLGGEFWMEVDANRDGIYELATPRRVITLMTGAGLLGMNAYQTSEMDNFEYHDAVLVPSTGSVPHIGTSYGMDLHVGANEVFLGALSTGNAGIPFIVEPRAIPLTPDGVFFATLGVGALGLSGISDASGLATISIPIPPNPVLIGLTLFASAFTVDGSRTFGVGKISNEQAFTIVQ
ncbi:MAG: hypothetical protein U1F36_17620 [Planctomycetota bacterium]